jgi:transcriptional regulator with XRE-family HTH domain
MDSMGTRIRKAREELGISQEDLARYVGVTKQTVSKIEHHLIMPRTDRIVRIAQYLQMSCDQLLGALEETKARS